MSIEDIYNHMRRSQLIKLIRECLREMDKPEDWEPDENEPEDWKIDPDVDEPAYGKEDIWPGSDIEGVKKGGTGFPHGQGYPNYRREDRVTKDQLKKILHINHIEGIPEDDLDKEGHRDQQATYNFIKKYFPWVLNFKTKREGTGEWYYHFADLFSNNAADQYWRSRMYELVNHLRGDVLFWKDRDPEEIRSNAKTYPHWQTRFDSIKQILGEHPDFVQVMERIMRFLDQLYEHSVENPANSANYPMYVSLYDVTRRLGGYEEGGWWYDDNDPIYSIKVNSKSEAWSAVKKLIRAIPQADLNGKPSIILEKDSGHLGGQPPPTYS